MERHSVVSINIQERREQENWKPIQLPDFEQTHDKHIVQKHSQEQCYLKLIDEALAILNKPTGSGKSIDICYIVRRRLEDNPLLKAIIAVPQTAIASSFTEELSLKYPDGTVLEWKVGWDYCNDMEGSVQGILDFLRTPRSKNLVSDRILVTTHAALIRAFQEDREAFRNLILAFDEAHHIQLDENLITKNENGHLIEYALYETDRAIQLILATATFLRGDRLGIIPEQYMSKFARFDLPYDEYLVYECKYLETFDYEFCLYKSNFKEILMQKLEAGVPKFIGYIPAVNSSYSLGDKYADVHAYYCSIAQSNDPVVRQNSNGTVSVFRGEKEYIGVNLVVEEGRDEAKKYVDQAHHHSDNSKLDFIIALNVFKEGANWKWAEQSFMIGFKHSLGEVLQSGIGRILRDAPGKKHASVCHIIPLTFDPGNKTMYWDKYNDYLKAVFSCMLLEQVFAPRLKPNQKRLASRQTSSQSQSRNFLLECGKDENELVQIQVEIHDQAMYLVGQCLSNQQFEEEFIRMAKGVLKNHGVTQHKAEIAKQLLDICKSATSKFKKMCQGLNSDEIDYEAIVGGEVMGFSFRLFSSDQDKDAMECLRKKIEERKSQLLMVAYPELFAEAIRVVED